MTRKPNDRAVRTLLRQEAHRRRHRQDDPAALAEAEHIVAVGFVAAGWPVVWQWREERSRRVHRRLGTLVAVAAALGVAR